MIAENIPFEALETTRNDLVEILREELSQAGAHFDEVVKCILKRRFEVNKPPDRKVCKECDLRVYLLN